MSNVFRFRHFAAGIAAFGLAVTLANTAAADGIQRSTFTIDDLSTFLDLSGSTTGVLNEGTPAVSRIGAPNANGDGAPLSPQTPVGLRTRLGGTITADISFNTTSRQITGIRIIEAQIDPVNRGPGAANDPPGNPGYLPGNWNGSAFPNSGTDKEAAQWGGNVGGFINFAVRNAAFNLASGTTVYSTGAPGVNGVQTFTASSGEKFNFSDGDNDIYGSGLVDDRFDVVNDYLGFEIDLNAIQPMLDSNGNPNPDGGKKYPQGLVWRYVTGSNSVSENFPNGDPTGNMVTQYTYGALAPAFDITKGGVANGFEDTDWYLPKDNAVGKPDAVQLYDPVTNKQSSLFINGTDINRKDANFGNPTGNPNPSNIDRNTGANNDFNVELSLNMDFPGVFFVGDFSVQARFGQGKNAFGHPENNTGIMFADATLNLLPGDGNFDGDVNIFDVGIVSDNWTQTGPAGLFLEGIAPGTTGDVNGDGSVDIFDVGTVSDWWMQSAGVGAAQSVPEPSSIVLLLVGGALAWGGRRTWRRARG